jgi:hypothetical protein
MEMGGCRGDLSGLGAGCSLFSRHTVGNRALCAQYCTELLCQQSQTQATQGEIHLNSVASFNAARSEAWVCGCSLDGVAGSSPAGSIDVCLL